LGQCVRDQRQQDKTRGDGERPQRAPGAVHLFVWSGHDNPLELAGGSNASVLSGTVALHFPNGSSPCENYHVHRKFFRATATGRRRPRLRCT